MSRKILVIIVSCFCCFIVSNAQDSILVKTKHSIGIYSGYGTNLIRDDLASPLLYKGANSPLFFEYDFTTNKGGHSIAFSFGGTKLRSSVSNEIGSSNANYADNFNAFLSYSYRRDADIFQHQNIKSSLGFTFLSVFNYRSLHLGNSSTIPFFEQVNSLGASFLIKKNVGLKKLDFACLKINLPFIAYVTLNNRYNAVVGRSLNSYNSDKGIFGQVIRNGEFVSFNKLFEFQTELSYNKFLTDNLALKIEHQLHYYSLAHYRNLLYACSLNNQFLIGLIIKF